MGFRLGPGVSSKKTAGAPWLWLLAAGVIFGGVGVGWLASRGLVGGRSASDDREIDPRPIILSLQKIGQLHTAQMTMKDVLRQSSEKPAEGWFREVPGSDAVARWATHNEALVVAQGTVEAGVDLSDIKARDVTPVRLADGSRGLRVHLPPPVVYPPAIKVNVQHSESGLLWKDDNLALKAQEEASRRFIDAAEKDHIRDHAKENALQTLQQMQQALGQKNVEFTF